MTKFTKVYYCVNCVEVSEDASKNGSSGTFTGASELHTGFQSSLSIQWTETSDLRSTARASLLGKPIEMWITTSSPKHSLPAKKKTDKNINYIFTETLSPQKKQR